MNEGQGFEYILTLNVVTKDLAVTFCTTFSETLWGEGPVFNDDDRNEHSIQVMSGTYYAPCHLCRVQT
jgi:hypothetical protein